MRSSIFRVAVRAAPTASRTCIPASHIRTLTSVPFLRPTTLRSGILAAPRPVSILVPALTLPFTPMTAATARGFSASAALCGPRNTMNRNSRLKRKRKHGFLARIRTKSGRKMLQRRKDKGRRRLSN